MRIDGFTPRVAVATFLIFGLLAGADVFARTLYVATNGSDVGSGRGLTPGAPFATINKAAEVAVAGDTVLIAPGTYYPTTFIKPANSGTQSAPIIYRADGGEVIIDAQLNFPTYNWDGPFWIVQKNWIVVDGLKVINSRFFGFIVDRGTNITIQNCATDNTWGSGIYVRISSFVKILNNTVRRACVYPTTEPRINVQECITLAGCTDFEVAGNVVFDRLVDSNAGGEGIDAKGSCARGSIHHNRVYDLVRLGIYLDSYASLLTDIEVYGNEVFNCGSGIVVASEEGGTVRGVKIYDNLVRDNARIGIRLAGYLDNGPIQDVEIFNNTVVRNGVNAGSNYENTGLLIEASDATNRNLVVRNNIFSGNGTPIRRNLNVNTTTFTVDRNVLFGPANGNGGVTGTNAITSDPRYVNSAANDFRLRPESPAIDAAVLAPISTTDYLGVARPLDGNGDELAVADLGAFERMIAQPTDGIVRADFSGGAGSTLPQQIPGNAGDGWLTRWLVSPSVALSAASTTTLGDGGYARVTRTGGTISQEGIRRRWSSDVRPTNQFTRLTGKIRMDSANDVFRSVGDVLTITDRATTIMGAGDESTFFLRAFGVAPNARVRGGEWGAFDGDPGVANAFDAERFVPLGVTLTSGVIYTFTIDVYAAPAAGNTGGRAHGTYDVTITGSDGQSGRATGLGFRSAATTLGGHLSISGQQDNANDGLAFSVDSVEIRSLAAAALTPRERWQRTYFPAAVRSVPALETTVWGDNADPDGDGFVNLLEFAVQTSPVTGSHAAPTTVSVEGNRLRLTFTRLDPAPVRYAVEASENMSTWEEIAFITPGGSWQLTQGAWFTAVDGPIGINGNPTRITTVHDRVTLTDQPRFLRLRITPP